MKRIKITLSILLLSFCIFSELDAQTTAGILQVHDTRNVNDRPNFLTYGVRADFKLDNTVGLPTGVYSTNLTVSPWKDTSAGYVHQLNFNNDGLYYRNATFTNTSWNAWRKILMVDMNGKTLTNLGVKGVLTVDETFTCKVDRITNWNTIWRTGFYECASSTPNAPNANFWGGINIGLASNTSSSRKNLQLVMQHNANDIYFRCTDAAGAGAWSRILHDTGAQKIKGNLTVAGIIYAREIQVTVNAGADYVFSPEYNLKPLSEVKSFVTENQHLPDIPSEKEMIENGLSMNEFQIKLLQKIEELTLYIIDQQEEMEVLKTKVSVLENSGN